MSSQGKDEYKSVQAHQPSITSLQSKEAGPRPGWLKRKYLLIKKAGADFWVVGRYGFQLGGLAGLILGFVFGGYESMRMKSIWPLPIAMISSGFTFGCIFAISTVLRAKTEKEEYDYPNYDLIYYDSFRGRWVREKTTFGGKHMNNFNKRL